MNYAPNTHDDLHWERELIGVIQVHLPRWLPFAGMISRDLCQTYGPHRAESKTPQVLIDYMFMNADEITADFHQLIQREL
jgi:hypothetical protein